MTTLPEISHLFGYDSVKRCLLLTNHLVQQKSHILLNLKTSVEKGQEILHSCTDKTILKHVFKKPYTGF